MEESVRWALGTVDNDRRQAYMWGESPLFTSRTFDRASWPQENANPRADPTTMAVRRSGSATMRQLLRNVSSMMRNLLEEGWVSPKRHMA
jgi:hypothetical protein